MDVKQEDLEKIAHLIGYAEELNRGLYVDWKEINHSLNEDERESI